MIQVSETCDVCGKPAEYVCVFTWNVVFLGWSFCRVHFADGDQEVRALERAHYELERQGVDRPMICRIISERLARKELLPSLLRD